MWIGLLLSQDPETEKVGFWTWGSLQNSSNGPSACFMVSAYPLFNIAKDEIDGPKLDKSCVNYFFDSRTWALK